MFSRRQLTITGLAVSLAIVALPTQAYAHVTVKPAQVDIGAYQTFTTSVPNEKDIPVTEIRLVIPSDIQSTTPTVKPGWEIDTKKDGDKVSEITWRNGTIPAGFRDEFTFSAQAPAKAGELQWKAYQTYEDGSVVSWDQAAAKDGAEEESEDKGPYSTTKVVNDLKTADDNHSSGAADKSSNKQTLPLALSAAAFVLSVVAIVIKRK